MKYALTHTSSPNDYEDGVLGSVIKKLKSKHGIEAEGD